LIQTRREEGGARRGRVSNEIGEWRAIGGGLRRSHREGRAAVVVVEGASERGKKSEWWWRSDVPREKLDAAVADFRGFPVCSSVVLLPPVLLCSCALWACWCWLLAYY